MTDRFIYDALAAFRAWHQKPDKIPY